MHEKICPPSKKRRHNPSENKKIVPEKSLKQAFDYLGKGADAHYGEFIDIECANKMYRKALLKVEDYFSQALISLHKGYDRAFY